ncbi:MAG: hypothetical protein QOE43_72 [Gaiellaceae bacterium]|jgi:hypothetical protein|nr:hypothetical protein [Gaiellaceae bacterium]
MAHDVRHAAWQTERRFAVRILPEDGPPADLASGLTEFLDAFDLASEWVSREDPARDGTASLAIVETQDGVAEEVWTYTPGQPAPDFSPLNWAAAPEFPSRQRKSRLRERVGSAVVIERAPAVVPPSAPPPPSVVVARPEPKPVWTAEAASLVRESPRQRVRLWVRTAWNDRLARVCLIGSGASLWFSVGLADPHFLLPLLVFLPALWWRHRNRVEPAAGAEPEDWL